MQYYKNKHVLGELTFGEYWNLAGCNAAAVKIKGVGKPCFEFELEDGNVRFRWSGAWPEESEEPRRTIRVPMSSKVKIIGNKVKGKDESGKEITLEFFDLSPTKNPVEI
jgi:hypothetical protein